MDTSPIYLLVVLGGPILLGLGIWYGLTRGKLDYWGRRQADQATRREYDHEEKLRQDESRKHRVS